MAKTTEELQEIIDQVSEYTGIKDLSKIKDEFPGKFVSRTNLTKDEQSIAVFTGYLTGKIKTKLKQILSLESSEVEGLNSPEEYVEVGLKKFQKKIEELEAAQGQQPDEKYTELLSKFEKTDKKLKEELETKKALQKTLETEKENWQKEKRGITINALLSSAKSKSREKMIDLDEDKEYVFDNKINELFKFDLDENEKPVVFDKEGNRIPNPDKAGEFLDYEGALLSFARQKDYIKKNQGGSIPAAAIPQPTITPNGTQPTVPGVRERVIHPAALENLAVLKAAEKR